MARRKDLAGLAALAGLGMLMARKKAGSAEPVKASSASEAKETKEAPSESEEDPMEAANKRTERTLIPNERGAAGTSEAVFPSSKPGSGNRPAAKPAAKSATDNVPRLIDRTPPVGTGSGGGRGPTAEELAAYKPPVSSKYPDIRGSAADSERANMRKNIREGSQAVEGVYPEQMIGGPGLKTMHSIAKGLAARTGGAEAKAASPYLKELPYSGTKQLPNAPTKQLPYDKAGAVTRAREARAAARNEEMLRENARRSGLDPDNMNPEVAKRVREGLGGSDFSLPMKKGGKVKGYANGGSVGSASKRGDGIASRGKTKCKMY
jgi:hypothetical protein